MTTPALDHDDVGAVRAFNRRYTRLIGVLEEHLLDSDFSLTEARILFELAHSGPLGARTLRTELGLDPGYLSRILARFESAGLVRRQRSDSDARRQLVQLTEAGRVAADDLDRRSAHDIAALLAGHSAADRHRLRTAMRTIEELLDPAPAAGRPSIPAAGRPSIPAAGRPSIPAAGRPDTSAAGNAHEVRLRSPRPGDYGWIIQRNAVLYAAEYGWNTDYEALVATIVADFLAGHDPDTERAWIAETGGAAAGAVFCVREDDTTARLRLLLVEPSARGLGVGTALVEQCLRFATEAGYRDMVLWTNDVLTAARRIYQRAGFELVDSRPHHSFGADLVGQTWRRSLR
ncbi:bifunctional helix-turn-helix transcriptional regulator/GNAT family N-acetyltransferase [Nocardia africana]|uniref:Organic hydroperoxide resistance transcriptional regulator n=1 Tax=Nocardia africana TaxID=134964 RepID=A0A378WRR3_9NOCA|nr:bifunctional helix-turn-helix transcriptional regulator/GNAT family N-acetyltransferase [Nocardia africana]MCC3314573.1 bifunctional helix-turn-helix transcriptional regulator/GNAT family N-acetyltransferase [Nocardia africana]SUA43151.1 Organic hydroperoxide resistance transcriptional regulator [Nocardia africana]